jgi:Ca2+-binding RTX toxin-like protein
MSQASYSLVNENNLSLRPASAQTLTKNGGKLGACSWESELGESIQYRDRVKLVTPKFAIAKDVPLLLENDLARSTKVERSKSNNRNANINEVLIVDPAIPKTTLHELVNQNDTAKLAVDGQDVVIVQTTGSNPAFNFTGLTRLRNDPQFRGIDGSGLTVVVIDTGLDATHPLIRPNFTGFVDIAGGGTFTTDPNNAFDVDSHGTHVAGTVGATDPSIGVAPDVNIIALQVFERSGGAYNSKIEEALDWVLDNRQRYNIVAVNMSLGGGQFFTSRGEAVGDVYADDIGRLEQAGVTVVSAAGNDYDETPQRGVSSPGIVSSLVVGAVNKQDDTITYFSQRLDAPNMIFAPGGSITSSVPGGGLEDKDGTSMASPHIAGFVALMQEAALQFGGRLLSPAEVVQIMRSTADTINDGDDENDFVPNTGLNFPRVNIYKAVTEIKRRFNRNAPPPPPPPGGGGGNAGDSNGTIAGAIIGPTLDGSPVGALRGSIGIDGQSTRIGAKDVDIYKFRVTTAGTIVINVGSDAANPRNFDSFLRIFNSNGTQIASNDDINDDNRFSRLSINLQPGTYYAGISGYSNDTYNPRVAGSGIAGATGNYSLQFSFGNADPNGTISGAVAVNFSSRSNPAFEGFIGADYGKPVGVSDVDIYKIVVPDNGVLFVDIDTPFSSGYVDSYVRVFEADGRQAFFEDTGARIVSDDDRSYTLDSNGNAVFTEFESFGDEVTNSSGNFVGHRTDSFIGGTVQRGDVYYIGVSDFDNQDYDARTLGNRPAEGASGGDYNISFNFINNDINGSIAQALVSNPISLSSRQTIINGNRIGADFRPNGNPVQVGDRDVDFRKIRTLNAGILEIDVDSFQNASISTADKVDTVVFIYDAQGRQLAVDDNTNSRDAKIQYKVQANRDYYVAIAGKGNDNFDPFQLGSGSSGDIGQYTFKSRLLPLAQAASLSDNGSRNGSVRRVGIGSRLAGDIGKDNALSVGSNDVDIYRFTPTLTGFVNIRTFTNQEFSGDTFLRLFAANGREITFNNNINRRTRSSLVRVYVTAGTQYLIGVNGAGRGARNYNPITGVGAAPAPINSLGTYTLSINAQINRRTGTRRNDILVGTSGIDSFNGGAGNDRIAGLAGSDFLIGGLGSDTLNGGLASDTLNGGLGNDTYFINNARDRIVETSRNPREIDTVISTVNHALGVNLERLNLGGRAITGVGNSRNNRITGNRFNNRLLGAAGNDVLIGAGGNDLLNGGLGIDTLNGGLGNDTYFINNARDRIVETSRNPREIDTVISTVNYVLGANLERLNLGGRAITGVGNSRNNRITGNRFNNRLLGAAGNDVLIGAGGNDLLNGGVGNDILTGGGGNDILVGGAGRDTLIGGIGRDRFVFQARNQGVDRISGFSTVFDRIDVSSAGFGGGLRGGFLAASQFRIGARALDRSDRVLYNRANGILSYDSDGMGAIAPTAIAILNPGLSLSNADIFITA